jgi:DNA helicase IV
MGPEEIIARQQASAAAVTEGAAGAGKKAATFVLSVVGLYLLYRWLK